MESFEARVGADGVSIELPIDVRQAFGRARPPVKARLNGYEYRTTVSVYGGRYYLGARREVRAAAGGLAPGDPVAVELELDTEPRVVEVPGDLAAALDREQARRSFDSFPYSHQREYVDWIEEAKRPQTRERRIAKTVEGTLAGKPQR